MNQNNKIDRRVRKTKKALMDSLIQLLETKPINKISVSELCELADVNRSSFYKYYSDPFDLVEQIENELFQKLYADWDHSSQTLSDIITTLVRQIYEQRDFCKILLGTHVNVNLQEDLVHLTHDSSIAYFKKKNPSIDNSKYEYLFTFIFQGSLGIIEQWINTGCNEHPDEIASLIEALSTQLFKH